MADDTEKKTILTVDDAPENIDIVKAILVPDYIVKAAINGKMALKIAQSQKPDLILLDVLMPGMDGFEVCRQLKLDPATRDIPVIFLTGETDPTSEAKGLELGAVAFVLKPADPTLLKDCVGAHVG
jgi:putative two-component system response regulator